MPDNDLHALKENDQPQSDEWRVGGSIAGPMDLPDARFMFETLTTWDSTTQIMVTNAMGYTVFVNPAFTANTGYSLEDMVGRRPGQVLQGADSDPATIRQMSDNIRQGRGFKVEILNYKKQGQPYWNSLDVKPVRDASGTLTHFLAMQTNVTVTKEAADRLALLEACVARLNDVIVITEAEPVAAPGPRIVYVNDTFERQTGYSREEALGNTPRMLQSSHTNRDELDRMREALLSWEPTRVELLNRKKNGEQFWSEIDIAPVGNRNGLFTHWVSVQRDITQRKQFQQELNSSLSLVTSFINACSDMVSIKNENGEFVLANQAFSHFFGKEVPQIIGRRITDLLPDEPAVQWLSSDQSIMNGDVPSVKEEYNLFEHRLEVRKFPVEVGQGRIGVGCIIRDTTEARQTQQSLQESLGAVTRNNAILEAAGRIARLGQWEVYLDGRPPMWSNVTYQIHDLEPDVPVTLEMAISFYAPEHQENVRRCVQRCIDGGENFEFEAIVVTAKQNRVWVRAMGEAVKDESGVLKSMRGVLLDIDREKRARLQLEAQDLRLAAISNHVPGLIFQFRRGRDGSSSFPFLSAAVTEIWGLPPGTVSCAVDEVAANTHPEDRAELQELIERSAEDFSVCRHEYRYFHPAKGMRWLRAASTPTPEETGNIIWHGYVEDITRSKEIEETLRESATRADAANRAKSAFLSNMSHEIRTPLNAVLGMAELLNDSPMPDAARSYVETIRNSGEALLSIINEILDFSKIEADSVQLQCVRMNLRECLASSLDIVAGAARAKGLKIVEDIEESCPEYIYADPVRVRQVLINLLSNATKFTAEGFVHVRVWVQGGEVDEPATMCFSVRDTGIGIHPDRFDRLFQRFSQVHAESNRQYGGTGLGLAICHRLAALMDGHITVSSDPGVGSTFQFRFPLILPGAEGTLDSRTTPLGGFQIAEGADTESTAEFAQPLRALAEVYPLRILVAEDNPVNRKVVGLILAKLGYAPDFAANGEEAIAALDAEPYDVVLMDIQMPRMDGLTATREIHARFPHGARPVVIALTANATEEDRLACLRAGMDDYISKPLRRNDLARVLMAVARR